MELADSKYVKLADSKHQLVESKYEELSELSDRSVLCWQTISIYVELAERKYVDLVESKYSMWSWQTVNMCAGRQ